MAGGVGTRFWPVSTVKQPKQFLDILNTGKTLIQQTYERVRQICSTSNIYVVTSKEYYEITRIQLPEIHESQILLEPQRRNTAPCIAYATYKIREKCRDANIIVAPSDHLILREGEFIRVIEKALNYASSHDCLLTLGIKPHRPETGYGYIQIKDKNDTNEIKDVKTFTEKPNYEMATIFVESGEFFWNAGIFVWSAKSILKAFEKHLPDLNELFSKGSEKYFSDSESEFIESTYSVCRNISIDYGIMEKAKNVKVICADFGWSDLGTWGSLYEHMGKDDKGNAIAGKNIIQIDSNNCIVNVSGEKLLVFEGLNDYIIAESEDKILIIRKKNEQNIKDIVARIEDEIGKEYV